jgi:hypothetical protein
MLTEYEATAVTKDRLRAASRKQVADEQMSVLQIEKRIRQAHKLRSEHLRALLTRRHSSNRIGVAVAVLCALSAAALFYTALSMPTGDAKSVSSSTAR